MNIERMAQEDGQFGDVLAGPLSWHVSTLPMPEKILALGLNSMSYLNKAVLLELFGYENVRRAVATMPLPALNENENVVLCALPDGKALTWMEFTTWLGRRCAMLDIRAAAAMLAASGYPARIGIETGNCSGALKSLRCRMSTAVYPNAPCVKIISNSETTRGFPVGAAAHLYSLSPEGNPTLAGLIQDEVLNRTMLELKGQISGSTLKTNLAALLNIPTPAGGCVSIMDLCAADRLPEPSGSETPAVQFFLNSIGWGTVVFGAFCRAVPKYEDFMDLVAGMAARFPGLAHIDTIGRSGGGRPIHRLRIGTGMPKPAVMFTCGIHPFEWANTYGILRYSAFLLEQLAADSPYAKYLLANREVHWVPAAGPDEWESRDQPKSGLDLNSNFPGTWERCVKNARAWDTYNKRFAPADPNPDITRGPAPASEPETRALMALLAQAAAPVSVLGDFHETTAPESFLHPPEEPTGSVRDWPYYRDLCESLADTFNNRFVSHANVLAFGVGLGDFPSYRLKRRISLSAPITNTQSGWINYAYEKISHALVIETAGADATNYQTLRRTEYAALAAEQILAAECGRLIRNPYSRPRETVITPTRAHTQVSAHIMDSRGAAVKHLALPANPPWRLTLPPGGWAWLDFS